LEWNGKTTNILLYRTVPLRSSSIIQENQLDAMNESLILADIKAEEKEKLFR
jgi:hypothetical protein